MDVELNPVQGDRFQPTGFPDIGAAEYRTPDDKRMILVESTQSMANRLEQGMIADDGVSIANELMGISYIKVRLMKSGNEFGFTSSLIEPHRLNSPYIRDGEIISSGRDFETEFKEQFNFQKGKPIEWDKFAKTIFKFDVNSLIHGLFLANYKDAGRLRVPRILSSFIEAENVREVSSGGVKLNSLDATGTLVTLTKDEKGKETPDKADVYVNVPYHTIQYTAERITAYFNIDTSLLRSYKLGDSETKLVFYLCLYKIRHFLNSSLRLRTACDLKAITDIRIQGMDGEAVPAEEQLLKWIKELIPICKGNGSFAEPPETLLECKITEKKGSEYEDQQNPDGE